MEKPNKTLADYVVVAISPVLIMLLVGCLNFFLIQLLYRGPLIYGIRWLMFWFVLAIVLVSRIGIEQGKWQARLYGAALAVVTWIYLAYMHGTAAPSVFGGTILLGISWFCAHWLTVDCTLIREDEDASGEGVLQSLLGKLERTLDPPGTPPLLAPMLPLDIMVAENLAKRRARKSVRPPGRTVVWFSLAALPLFGFGQLFLPANDPHARRVGFAFLAAYLAAALGLLATTSFLGLRRYLRQRFAEMPASVTLAWLKFGVFLVGGVLLLALILPRPGANSTWKELAYRIEPKPHKASKVALPFNSPGEGEGTPTDTPVEREQRGADSPKPALPTGGNSPQRQNRPQPNSNSNPDQSPQPSSGGSGSGGSHGSSGDQEQTDQSGDKSNGETGDKSPPRSIKLKDNSGAPDTSGSGDGDVPGGDDSRKRKGDKIGDGNGEVTADSSQDSRQAKESPRKPKEKRDQPAPKEQPEQEEQPRSAGGPKPPNQFLAQLLRVLAVIALVALLIWFLIRYRKALADMMRALWNSIREFFRKLLALRWRRKTKNSEAAPDPLPELPPFATYENPFVTGKDKTWSSDRLLTYTYEAICAWAKQHQIALRPQETPREFCLRLLGHFPDSGENLEQFSTYYTYLAFANRLPGDYETDSLRRLWQYLGDSLAPAGPR